MISDYENDRRTCYRRRDRVIWLQTNCQPVVSFLQEDDAAWNWPLVAFAGLTCIRMSETRGSVPPLH